MKFKVPSVTEQDLLTKSRTTTGFQVKLLRTDDGLLVQWRYRPQVSKDFLKIFSENQLLFHCGPFKRLAINSHWLLPTVMMRLRVTSARCFCRNRISRFGRRAKKHIWFLYGIKKAIGIDDYHWSSLIFSTYTLDNIYIYI